MKYTDNFVKTYEESFRRNFELPALSDYGTDISFTYKELAVEIEKLHILFEEYSVGEGEKIALIGKNSSYWGVIYLATMTYGAVVVPILQDFPPDDVHHIIEHSGATLFFVSEAIMKNLDRKKMPGLRELFTYEDRGLSAIGERNLQKELTEKFGKKFPSGYLEDDVCFREIPNERVMILNYTSGTTGFSKGVLLTGDNLVGNLIYARYTIGLKRGDRMVSLLPLAHAYGGAFEFLLPIQEGCHAVFLGKTPTPSILLKAFGEIKPNLIIAVPLILEKIYKRMIVPVISKKSMAVLLKIPGINSLIYSTIRKKLINAFGGQFIQVVIGGAPLNAEVEAFLLKIKFPVSVGYGMTECAPLISFSLYKDYIKYSCGKILPNMEVRIDSLDPYNTVGEIQVKGQNVMQGYYNNEEATSHIFTDDGWLKTGDLGTIDRNNNIFIRGRSKNMLLGPSGQNIYPEGIEAKLDNLPFVAESVVVGRDNKLVALVFPDLEAASQAGIKQDELKNIMESNLAALNKSVASYEKVAEIELRDKEFEKTPKKSIKRYMYS
ncbi:MAG: AMP-binding protein [Dysgonamonadaceae bacterium]|jgi:long-chain acyl-CoA synthetase|nr:AMP-binding protein [Dysgonamonadaceae bacterium]